MTGRTAATLRDFAVIVWAAGTIAYELHRIVALRGVLRAQRATQSARANAARWS